LKLFKGKFENKGRKIGQLNQLKAVIVNLNRDSKGLRKIRLRT